jgi:drug/metabolite transporter (DMT)-like permease
MEFLLGIGAALTYGAGDFVGGLVTKRTHVASVVFASQLWGMGLVVALVVTLGGGPLTAGALAWGGAAGVAGSIGVVFLYRGLAGGRMAVVAPVTAVVAAALPVLFGLASGERPSGTALAGVALALAAIALVSRPAVSDLVDGASRHRGVNLSLVAGAGFAAFFILLRQGGAQDSLWPLLGVKLSSMAVAAALAAALSAPLRPARGSGRATGAVGILDTGANVLYLLASQRGLLALVAALTSLYPVTTVLLARVVLGERLTRPRLAGLIVAAAGVALMAAG